MRKNWRKNCIPAPSPNFKMQNPVYIPAGVIVQRILIGGGIGLQTMQPFVKERPALLDKLISTVEEAEKKLQMFHGSKEFFADGELDAFGNQISVVKSWLEAVKRELDQLQDNQDASFSTDDLKTKVGLRIFTPFFPELRLQYKFALNP